jgi:hypothetical protein
MKKYSEDLIPNYILADLHEFIYNECENTHIEVDDNDTGHLQLHFEQDGWFFFIEIECAMDFVDDSFSHEFGTYKAGHWGFKSIEDIDVIADYYDEDAEIEISVDFPYERFTKKLFMNSSDSDEKRKLNLQRIIAGYEEYNKK